MSSKRFAVFISVGFIAMLLLAGCAFTPGATVEADRAAKEFNAYSDAASVYVYRSMANRSDADTILYIDGGLIGNTEPGTYFRIDTVAGRHVLHGTGYDSGYLTLDVRQGELYFVSLDVIGRHSRFSLVPDVVARDRVRACCGLLENWGPAQRPIIR